MRIAFMGTPEFAACSLKKLIEAGHDICCVFSQPDKPKGRGMKMIPTPVKMVAESNAIPVFQPQKLRDGTALDILKRYEPELIAVVAYGRLLPKEIISYPKLGCVNIHASLLPKYRGAAPIQWSVLSGDEETGVCSIYMADEMDAGDVIAVRKTKIGECESFGELYNRLADIGASLLCDTVSAIDNGTALRTQQDHSMATNAPMISKSMSPVDWTLPAKIIKSHILGLDPQPSATAVLSGQIFKLFRAHICTESTEMAAGTIISAGKEGMRVACGESSAVLIEEIQAPGGKRMKVSDYIRGHELCGCFDIGDCR